MARKSNFTQADLDRMREAYEAWNPWDPNSPSAEELAASLGTTKSTLYTWRSRGWRLDGRPDDGETGWKTRKQTSVGPGGDLAPVVKYLTEELVIARARIAELESQLGR